MHVGSLGGGGGRGLGIPSLVTTKWGKIRAHSFPSKIFQKISNFFRKGSPLFFREKISAGEGVPPFFIDARFSKKFSRKIFEFFSGVVIESIRYAFGIYRAFRKFSNVPNSLSIISYRSYPPSVDNSSNLSSILFLSSVSVL